MTLAIKNKKYYSIKEIVRLSGVNMRTLRRWIANGDLDHYLHAYQSKNGPIMYRLDPPDCEDILLDGFDDVYQLPELNTYAGDTDEASVL